MLWTVHLRFGQSHLYELFGLLHVPFHYCPILGDVLDGQGVQVVGEGGVVHELHRKTVLVTSDPRKLLNKTVELK